MKASMYWVGHVLCVVTFLFLVAIRPYVRGGLSYIASFFMAGGVGVAIIIALTESVLEGLPLLLLIIPGIFLQYLRYSYDDLIMLCKPDNREIQFLD